MCTASTTDSICMNTICAVSLANSEVNNEAAYNKFIEKTINVQLPDHLNDSERFQLVKNNFMFILEKT